MKFINNYLRTVLGTLRYSTGELLGANVLWVLLMIPVITIPPAFAGLYYATGQVAKERAITFRTFFEGVKKYFLISYIWFLANVVVSGLLTFNILLALQHPEIPWLQFVSVINWVVLFIWVPIQVYAFPLLMEQDEPRLILALRNSAILWFKYISFNLFLVILFGMLVLVSVYIYPFWCIITAALMAYLSNLALISLLSKEKISPKSE